MWSLKTIGDLGLLTNTNDDGTLQNNERSSKLSRIEHYKQNEKSSKLSPMERYKNN